MIGHLTLSLNMVNGFPVNASECRTLNEASVSLHGLHVLNIFMAQQV